MLVPRSIERQIGIATKERVRPFLIVFRGNAVERATSAALRSREDQQGLRFVASEQNATRTRSGRRPAKHCGCLENRPPLLRRADTMTRLFILIVSAPNTAAKPARPSRCRPHAREVRTGTCQRTGPRRLEPQVRRRPHASRCCSLGAQIVRYAAAGGGSAAAVAWAFRRKRS